MQSPSGPAPGSKRQCGRSCWPSARTRTASGLQDTPKRVAKAYAEIFAGLHQDPAEILATTFDIDHEELVLVKDIPFYSTCEHHLVPFHGVRAYRLHPVA